MVPAIDDDPILKRIKLSAGAASTVDGYLVITNPAFVPEQINSAAALDEWAVRTTDIAFNKAVSVTLSSVVNSNMRQLRETKDLELVDDENDLEKFSAYELFAEGSDEKKLPAGTNSIESIINVSLADAIANYVLIAWVFVNEAENDHCQQGDCNTKGIQRNYVTRYFLIENTSFSQMNKGNEGNASLSSLETCSVARIQTLYDANSPEALEAKTAAAWNASSLALKPSFFDTVNLTQVA